MHNGKDWHHQATGYNESIEYLIQQQQSKHSCQDHMEHSKNIPHSGPENTTQQIKKNRNHALSAFRPQWH